MKFLDTIPLSKPGDIPKFYKAFTSIVGESRRELILKLERAVTFEEFVGGQLSTKLLMEHRLLY
jgi:hypothetical protein